MIGLINAVVKSRGFVIGLIELKRGIKIILNYKFLILNEL
jgi:hypothetical protein